MIRLAHSADWHLRADAKSAGLARWPDQQRVVRAFVDGALAQGCDLAVIAGDVFDTPKPGPAEIVFAQQELHRLSEHVLTVCIHGNHDLALGESPSPVAILEEARIFYVARPTVFSLAGANVACLPFPSKAQLLTREEYQGLSPEAVNALISDKLRAVLRGLRAQCDPKLPSILVAHLPIVGAKLNENMLAGQEHISLTAEDLEGWDYVALGDLHAAQEIGEVGGYSGSLDRLNFGEEHNTPGWKCVEVGKESATSFSYGWEFIETPARRFLTLSVADLQETDPAEYQAHTVETVPILRVKATVSQEEYDALQPTLAKWRELPTFTEQLDITRQTRARAEDMTGDITPERAIAQWHAANGRSEDLAALLELHREIAGRS